MTKILELQLKYRPSSEYSGLIFLKIDWFDLLAVQGTFRSLLQHHSLKASIFQLFSFFTIQLSQPDMTTGKTIALTIWTITLKSRGMALQTKVCLVKAVVFPVVMYGCDSRTVKKAEHQRIDAFELWC